MLFGMRCRFVESVKVKSYFSLDLSEIEQLWMKLYKCCQNNELQTLQNSIQTLDHIKSTGGSNESHLVTLNPCHQTDIDTNPETAKLWKEFMMKDYLNFCSVITEDTLLHAAVKSCSKEIIHFLLSLGCNPCIK